MTTETKGRVKKLISIAVLLFGLIDGFVCWEEECPKRQLGSQDQTCPRGQFVCGNASVCVEQRFWCDGIKHCPNGEDENEENCYHPDPLLDLHLQRINQNRATASQKTCVLDGYPDVCICKNATRLKCQDSNLTSFPSNTSVEVTKMMLQRNNIGASLYPGIFDGFINMRSMYLDSNNIKYLDQGTFTGLDSLLVLSLADNRVSMLQNGTFIGLQKLIVLILNDNDLSELHPGAFFGLSSLTVLKLERNMLWSSKETAGPLLYGLPRLEELHLKGNRLAHISSGLFQGLEKLLILILRDNGVVKIVEDSFYGMHYLMELDVSDNLIENLNANVFANSSYIESLYLGGNRISEFPNGIFQPMSHIQTLSLEDLKIENINVRMFSCLPDLELINFRSFDYCKYAPSVKDCTPKGDGISSFKNLLDLHLHRIFIWIVAMSTIVGNGVVLLGRLCFAGENKSHSLVIKNLAAADFMMGIYLIVIAAQDIRFRNSYNQHALEWMTSAGCRMAGVLAMSSSEISILILTFLSLERYSMIVHPYSMRKTSHKYVVLWMVVVWLLGAILGVLPLTSHHAFGPFYGTSGVCFPLHIHEPFMAGWQYSMAILVGLNGIAMMVIAFCYVSILRSIIRTRKETPGRLMKFSGDVTSTTFAKRFFLIVLTDALCWIPIIVIKLTATAYIKIPDDVHSWVAVFVLPINSALNPILYSLSTLSFRRKFSHLITRVSHMSFQYLSNTGVLKVLRRRSASGSSQMRSSLTSVPSQRVMEVDVHTTGTLPTSLSRDQIKLLHKQGGFPHMTPDASLGELLSPLETPLEVEHFLAQQMNQSLDPDQTLKPGDVTEHQSQGDQWLKVPSARRKHRGRRNTSGVLNGEVKDDLPTSKL